MTILNDTEFDDNDCSSSMPPEFYVYEDVDRALLQVENILNKALAEYNVVPKYHLLEDRLTKIKQTLESFSLRTTTLQPDDGYRTGMLCVIGGMSFWHTDSSYYLALHSAEGRQIDLRVLTGFKEFDKDFNDETCFNFSTMWDREANSDPEIRKHLDGLRAKLENLWWSEVVRFLREYSEILDEDSRARKILLENNIPVTSFSRILGTRYVRFEEC